MFEACLLIHEINNWKKFRTQNKTYQPNYIVVSRKNTIETMYGFPGGKKEVNESLAQCIERELLEETGFDVRKIQSKVKGINTFIPTKVFSSDCRAYSNEYFIYIGYIKHLNFKLHCFELQPKFKALFDQYVVNKYLIKNERTPEHLILDVMNYKELIDPSMAAFPDENKLIFEMMQQEKIKQNNRYIEANNKEVV